ncbi:MAG: oxidoreductase [Lachnospiraceae bacterium]|nr:oxidoreductase [Lachnospiraceae bacterium]
MGKLCMTLPPFSPDYSGVCSALFPFDALTVLHDASGCTGNYTGYDEARWFRSRSPIYCSGLREIDAILGDDEKLIQKVLYALEDVKPEIIALVGSPVPMVIGADMEGIAAEIESRTGIMSVGFATTGIRYYPQGIEMVYKNVVQRILKEDETEAVREENTVNIFGATPIDFGRSNTIEDLTKLLADNGIKVNQALWENVKKSDVVQLKNAACNIVVSHAGIALAEYMKKHYGIPYVTELPYGECYAFLWLEKLKKVMANTCKESYQPVKKEEYNESAQAKILIIGEQLQCNSIRNAIWAETKEVCDVAGICGWDTRFAKANDSFLESEAEIERSLNDEKYDCIIGDPLYQDLLHAKKNFYEVAHYAVSSKIANEKAISLIGKNISHLKNLSLTDFS